MLLQLSYELRNGCAYNLFKFYRTFLEMVGQHIICKAIVAEDSV
jgi:hypothetical protein